MKISSKFCLIKLLPYILSEKYINILALEMASPGNRQCDNYIGALSFVPYGIAGKQHIYGINRRQVLLTIT